MQSRSNKSKSLIKRRRTDRQEPMPPGAAVGEDSVGDVSETSSRRSAEFLEFAQAAGGFGVFELNLVTGQIKGTSLFFELIGLECRDMSLTREEWLRPNFPTHPS